jgi:tripartite ATP-independent transporter DctM subunit
VDLIEIALILLVLLTILLAGGVWIAIALMACGYAGMLFVGGAVPPGAVLATTVWGNSASWTLAALPLFIWMGEILFRTRLSEEMFRGLAPWLNRIPGRLMHVNVLACGIFGSVSGSSAATTATVAKIALPELKKRGYDEKVSLGSLAGAGTLGILIPPSIMMVIYAVQANVSIIQVFLAGFLPGLLVMVLYSGYIAMWSLMHPEKTPPAEPQMSLKEKLRQSAQLIPTMLLILLVFVALLFGLATATECAAWGVMGSLAIAWWHGMLSWPSFFQSVMGATRVTCMIMLILAGASYMSTSMAYTGVPQALATWVGSFGHRARRHLDDRADHRGGHSDGQGRGLRPRLVRYLRRAGGRDGRGVAAGRLQPVRSADHERQGFQFRGAGFAAVLLSARPGGCDHHGIP